MTTKATVAKLTSAFVLMTAAAAPPVMVLAPLTPAHAQSSGCVVLEPGGGSFWRAVNNCGYTVIGKFCYENDRYFTCGTQAPGGFGPIRQGGSEGISAPSSSYAR